jgi:hypothetical protein
MEKDSKDSWSNFPGYGKNAPVKYIKNYWPHLEVTPTPKIRSNIGLLVSNRGIQVAKTLRDLADPLQIWQSPFAYSDKIILLPVPICVPDTSVSVLQLRKRSLFIILVWKNSFDDGYLIHCPTLKKLRDLRDQMNCCRSSMTWKLILLMELQQATIHGFIISISRRLCLRNRQAMSFQEREKALGWRKLCLLFLLPIGSC